METESRVKIPIEDVCILSTQIFLGKSIDPSLLPPEKNKIVGISGFPSFGGQSLLGKNNPNPQLKFDEPKCKDPLLPIFNILCGKHVEWNSWANVQAKYSEY